MKKTAIFTFGRMNPFTTGHFLLATKLDEFGKKFSANKVRIYLSHTTNPKKDPLSYADKLKFAKQSLTVLPKVEVVKSNARTVIEVAKELEKQGFTDIILVVGSDRVKEFETLLTRYNGKEYNFDSIKVMSAGERDPDAEGVSGMSASKMREFAKNDDFANFKKGVSKALNDKQAKELFDKVRTGMKLNEEAINEAVLTFAQRRKRGMRLRRMQKRIQRARARQLKRFADPARLRRRAMKTAYKALRARFSGGKDYATMGTAEKIGLDKRLQKALPMVKKLATRLLPTVRRREVERRKSRAQKANEMFEQIMLERKNTPQDKDIKDKEGTQPSKYHSGLAKSTKEKRDAHFKKYAEKPDSDPSSYKDAPGDKEAREKGMRPSVHTLKYKKMFGEEISRKELSRLDMLVRMGLADKKLLQIIKRSVTKLDSGETLTPQERKAAFDLLQTLLDMTLSTDQMFRMTRMQLQKEDLDEAAYAGNIGAMEMVKFFQKANTDQKKKLKELIQAGKKSAAWQMVQKVTGTKLVGKQFEEREDPSRDGISMAQIELENLLDDAEELLGMLGDMDEEPEQWVLSKITKATDYISSARDYLEYNFYDDDEDDEDDEEEDDDEEAIDDALMHLISDGLTTEEYEMIKPITEEIEGLKKKAEKSGISYGILKKVYDRGMAAWKSGHRPGATPQQWAFARVNSFITKGKGTWGGADSDLAAKVSTNEEFKKKYGPLEIGTDAIRIAYARETPGQNPDLVTAKYNANTVLNVLNDIRTQRAKKLFDEDKNVVKEAIEMHLEKKIPFVENVFRVGSEKYFEFFREARAMNLQLEGFDKYLIEETDIGEIVEFEGQYVPLDCPMVEEWEEIVEEEEGKDPPLNKPKRGGPKKFYVYVRKPDGGIKKVTWGDTSGLSVKMNDPEARKSFAARHQCSTQKDRTSAAYWACRTPHYAKQLGLSGGGQFFW